MIRESEPFIHPPAPQPMGFRANAAINATTQARQDAERERRRVEQLERRNRRLRAWVSAALGLVVLTAVAAGAVGAVAGYAIGAGLLGLVR